MDVAALANPSGPSNTGPAGERARQRSPKACEECRKRKIRCHGVSPVPCDYCRAKRLVCVYRPQARRRRRRLQSQQQPSDPAGEVQQQLTGNSHDNDDNDDYEDDDDYEGAVGSPPIQEAVYAGVSATYADSPSPSRTLHLYYGPSSNFPMIQHIHQRLNRESGNVQDGDAATQSAIERVDEGLQRFRYNAIYFGKYSDQQDQSYPASGSGGAGGWGADFRRGPIDDSTLLFLPYGIATDFLSKFLTTLQRHLPFIDPPTAERQLAELYEARGLDIGPRAIILAVLAIGGTITEHLRWAEALYKRARALAEELDDVVNCQVCQLGLLLAHYNSISGKPNAVHLLIGGAARKALAAGLHKEALSRGRQSVDFPTVQTRRLTFWSIYIFEVTICYGLGRPISLDDADISIPYPEDNPFFVSLITLSRIYSRASRQLYGRHPSSLQELWSTALSLKSELDTFRSSLPPELAIGPSAPWPPPQSTDVILKLFLNNWYYHAMILTFRPFLILQAQLPKKTQPPPWLVDACSYCVLAAREILICIRKSMQLSDLARRLAYACFYIEGGAFTLLFNILRDKRSSTEDAKIVRDILDTMGTMYPSAPRDISAEAIGKMLKLAEEAVRGCGSPESVASGTPQTIPSIESRAATVPATPNTVPFLVQSGMGVEEMKVPMGEFEFGGPNGEKLNFDLQTIMDLDCWLALDGYSANGVV